MTADNDINLLAAQNTDDLQRKSSGQSGGVGVSITYGSNGFAFGITLSASGSKGKGKGEGKDVSWTETQLQAGQKLALNSGADTNLKGAIAEGKQITAQVGGDLNIESLQDSSEFHSKDQSIGGSVTIGYGFSASVSASQQKLDSTYKSVQEQSGLKAGDDGFQVTVKGNTDLKGAVISSTDKAVDDGKNSFSTEGTLTLSNLENRADYDGKATGVNLGAGMKLDGSQAAMGSGAGVGKESGSAASTTESGISGLAGNTTIRTGDSANGITKIFDAQKVQESLDAQVKITQAFGEKAGKVVADYAKEQRSALYAQLKNATSDEDISSIKGKIQEINNEERVLNVLIGAVSGMGGNILLKESLSLGAEKMREITIENSSLFKGVSDGKTVLNNVSGVSEGVRGDGTKGGGTRVDLDNICGVDNFRCVTTIDSNGNRILDLKDGMVQWDSDAAKGMTLAEFLNSQEGQKAAGATGGIQGWKGTLFGVPYAAGSWQDKLIEAFGGTHDYIGGQVTGLYDEQGNTKRGMSDTERFIRDRVSEAAILPSAPFAMAELLPPEVWKGISILLGGAR
ncbi:MAG: hemagglutinin repeat-containing protein [Oryzomicrobium sp.]|nr:hemagglutinin repeat-containing protein [Oryzomicrobium sp.]